MKTRMTALELILHLAEGNTTPNTLQHITKIAREALAEQPAQQEPVAWMHTMIDDVVIGHRPADIDRHPDRWTPLYKEALPCPTCEALARTVMLDQTSHDTSPPAQQKPLTVQEIAEFVGTHEYGPEQLKWFRLGEAAHGIKEKNA